MKSIKSLTEEQALLKLTSLCTTTEHCSWEMEEKMRKWQLPAEAIARNMAFLTEKHFVDDARYARFFINDKIKYNKWGRRKVEQALWQKRIPESVYRPIFEEMDDEVFMETLVPLLQTKLKSIKATSEYERNGKLIRFALGRGFSMEQIERGIEELRERGERREERGERGEG